MPELIRIRSKAALPQNWVYPVDVELISGQLYGISQYHKTCLRFMWKNSTAKWNQTNHTKIKLFEVVYTNPRDTVWPQHWSIDIYGVLREQADTLKEVCGEQALPAIRDWMSEVRPAFWYEKWKLLEINYDLERGELSYVEPGAV